MSHSQLKRVRGIRLSDQATDQIQTLIIEGRLQPGDKLPCESELAESLGMSRSSVREALRALESRGLIQVRSGIGAFVSERPFSFNAVGEAVEWLIWRQTSLTQILQVREVLEGLAASLLASRVTNEILEKLHEVVQQQTQLAHPSLDIDAESDLDIRFHQLIAEASGNLMVEHLVRTIVTDFCSSNRAILYVSGKIDVILIEHQRIIDALAAKDALGAESAIRAHIARVCADILTIHADRT